MSVFVSIEVRHYNDQLDRADKEKVVYVSATTNDPKVFLKLYAEQVAEQIDYDGKTDKLTKLAAPVLEVNNDKSGPGSGS